MISKHRRAWGPAPSGQAAGRHHRTRPGDHDTVPHPDGPAEPDGGLEGRARRDAPALGHARHPPTPGPPARAAGGTIAGRMRLGRRRTGVLVGIGGHGGWAWPPSWSPPASSPAPRPRPREHRTHARDRHHDHHGTRRRPLPPAADGPCAARRSWPPPTGSIPGYPAPGQPSDMTVPGTWWGYPSVLPVIASTPGWLEVRLAQRPNGSTTWVQQSQVVLGEHALFHRGRSVHHAPHGVRGRHADPGLPCRHRRARTTPRPRARTSSPMQYPRRARGTAPSCS